MNFCSVNELKKALGDSGTTLIDVRSVEEFSAGHLPFSINIPIGSSMKSYADYLHKPLYIYCQTDRRAQRVAEELVVAGASDVTVVKWGYLAWRMAGFAVES